MKGLLLIMNMDVTKVNPFTLPSVSILNLDSLPNLGGVYFAISAPAEILYIGKAIDIYQRWRSHHRFDDINVYSNVKIAYLPCIVSSEDDLSEIETACIMHFRPQLNKTIIPNLLGAELLIQSLKDAGYQEFLALAETQRRKITQGVTAPEALFVIYKVCANQLTLKGKRSTMGDLMTKGLIKYLVEDILPTLE